MKDRFLQRVFDVCARPLLFSTFLGIVLAPSTARASEWTSADVGGAQAGSATEDPTTGVWTVQGGGADIWGSSDAFHFLYRAEPTTTAPKVRVIARIDDVQDTDPFAKAGVMLRTSLNADAATVLLDVKPSGEVEFMDRSADGGQMEYVGGILLNFPVWLRLECDDSGTGASMTCVPEVSEDGIHWNFNVAPGRTFPLPQAGYLSGLAVTSHDASTLTTAHAAALRLLSGFEDDDIGATGLSSNAAEDILPADGTSFQNRFTVQGAGADIWGSADSFAFVHGEPLGPTQSGALRYRVVSVGDTNPFAKAGLMFRDSLAPGSVQVVVDMKPSGELEFMARTCDQCPVNYLGGAFISLPAYLELDRVGGTFTVKAGASPSTVTTVGTVYIPMSNAIPGFAVTSHDTSQLTTAVFDEPWTP